MLKSQKCQIIIIHAFDTIHPLHWNPVSTELTWGGTSWEEHKERFGQSVSFTDHILDFYLSLFEGNTKITRIVMGDHGINLETEYAHDIANRPINGNIGLWDMESV